MTTFYVKTTGSSQNSGSTDADAASLSGSAATVSGSVITLDGSPDLSGLITSGDSQSTIFLNDATNSNQKIFKITAFDNSAKTVTVSVAPTGITSSVWKIGGRLVWTPANIEAALAAGDIVEFKDSPASSASSLLTCRASGNTTAGFITLRGATGTRPLLVCTGTANVIAHNNQTRWWIENLEAAQQGASGNAIQANAGWVLYNVKVSDAGADGIASTAVGLVVIACEISGCGGRGVYVNSATAVIVGNNIHDNGSEGVSFQSFNLTGSIALNTIHGNAGRGIYLPEGFGSSAGYFTLILLNTIYGNANSGLENVNANQSVALLNNILSENGDASGEYNVEWTSQTIERCGVHAYNLLHHSGGGGASNVSGMTLNATELSSDPLFTNAGSDDYSLGSSSPAKGAGFPGQLLGGSLGYFDLGAVQRQEAGGGSPIARPGLHAIEQGIAA